MWKRTVLLIALLAFSPVAQAAPLSFYTGGSLGTGIGIDAGDLRLSDFGAETDDQTWKLFAGIGIGRIFGIEAAWHDFGTVSCCAQVADAGFDINLQGLSVAAVAGIPLNRLRLFAKAGLVAWEADGEVVTFSGPLPFSADGEDPMGGVGADFKVNKRLAVRAEWEVFKIDEGTLDSASVGVQYKF